MKLPEPVPEFRFEPTRKWRFDWAWPEYQLALEVDGGLFVLGGHNRGAQIVKTMEKENEAQVQGWHILKCQPHELCTCATVHLIQRAIENIKNRNHK